MYLGAGEVARKVHRHHSLCSLMILVVVFSTLSEDVSQLRVDVHKSHEP